MTHTLDSVVNSFCRSVGAMGLRDFNTLGPKARRTRMKAAHWVVEALLGRAYDLHLYNCVERLRQLFYTLVVDYVLTVTVF